jgi:DNA-binding MarR family transcriptional regulator
MAQPKAQLDPHLQAPARLKLMTMLTAVTEVEFATLRDSLEVADSVLSKHVSLLAGVGYVKSRKGSHAGRRTTWISITGRGRKVLKAHVVALREIIAGVE